MTEYHIVVAPLDEADGGGYIGYVPDLIGCMGDGDTPEAALKDTIEAISAWIATEQERDHDVPAPGSGAEMAQNDMNRINDVIREQQELIKDLRDRLEQTENEKAAMVARWRPTVMFENPASAKKQSGRLPFDPPVETVGEILDFPRKH